MFLSTCLYVNMSSYIYSMPSTRLPACLFTCLLVQIYNRMPVYYSLLVHRYMCKLVRPITPLLVYLYTYLPVYLPTCLIVTSQLVYLSTCLSFFSLSVVYLSMTLPVYLPNYLPICQ